MYGFQTGAEHKRRCVGSDTVEGNTLYVIFTRFVLEK